MITERGYHMSKQIIDWQSKIQINKGTPFISLSKLLCKPHGLNKGTVLHCDVIINDSHRLIARVFLDGNPAFTKRSDLNQRKITDFVKRTRKFPRVTNI